MFKKVLMVLALLISTANAAVDFENKKVLTVYYSWGGNTKYIATKIQEKVGGDIFELVQEEAYPDKYNDVIKVAKPHVDSDYTPKLKNKISNVNDYDIIFIGSPIWWGTIAPAVKTFLVENDLSNKTVIPFVSHGGGGKGKSETVFKQFMPKSNILSMQSFSGKGSDKNITKWIKKISK